MEWRTCASDRFYNRSNGSVFLEGMSNHELKMWWCWWLQKLKIECFLHPTFVVFGTSWLLWRRECMCVWFLLLFVLGFGYANFCKSWIETCKNENWTLACCIFTFFGKDREWRTAISTSFQMYAFRGRGMARWRIRGSHEEGSILNSWVFCWMNVEVTRQCEGGDMWGCGACSGIWHVSLRSKKVKVVWIRSFCLTGLFCCWAWREGLEPHAWRQFRPKGRHDDRG